MQALLQSTYIVVHCANWTGNCADDSALCTVHYAQCTMNTMHYAQYTLHSTLCTLHYALCTAHNSQYIMHSAEVAPCPGRVSGGTQPRCQQAGGTPVGHKHSIIVEIMCCGSRAQKKLLSEGWIGIKMLIVSLIVAILLTYEISFYPAYMRHWIFDMWR